MKHDQLRSMSLESLGVWGQSEFPYQIQLRPTPRLGRCCCGLIAVNYFIQRHHSRNNPQSRITLPSLVWLSASCSCLDASARKVGPLMWRAWSMVRTMHHQGEREDRSWAFLNTIYGQDRKLVEHYLMHAYMKYDNVYIYIYILFFAFDLFMYLLCACKKHHL